MDWMLVSMVIGVLIVFCFAAFVVGLKAGTRMQARRDMKAINELRAFAGKTRVMDELYVEKPYREQAM